MRPSTPTSTLRSLSRMARDSDLARSLTPSGLRKNVPQSPNLVQMTHVNKGMMACLAPNATARIIRPITAPVPLLAHVNFGSAAFTVNEVPKGAVSRATCDAITEAAAKFCSDKMAFKAPRKNAAYKNSERKPPAPLSAATTTQTHITAVKRDLTPKNVFTKSGKIEEMVAAAPTTPIAQHYKKDEPSNSLMKPKQIKSTACDSLGVKSCQIELTTLKDTNTMTSGGKIEFNGENTAQQAAVSYQAMAKLNKLKKTVIEPSFTSLYHGLPLKPVKQDLKLLPLKASPGAVNVSKPKKMAPTTARTAGKELTAPVKTSDPMDKDHQKPKDVSEQTSKCWKPKTCSEKTPKNCLCDPKTPVSIPVQPICVEKRALKRCSNIRLLGCKPRVREDCTARATSKCVRIEPPRPSYSECLRENPREGPVTECRLSEKLNYLQPASLKLSTFKIYVPIPKVKH